MKKNNEYKGVVLPSGLKKQAISFMENIINNFEENNKLNSLDHLSLYLLASNINQFLICEENIRKNGLTIISDRGNESLSPYCNQQKTVQNSILALLKELGLTLGSRAKIKVLDNGEDESPLMQLLKDN